ncbi:TetR/AcrR family transcriptional regulator [Jiella sp. MQZ9-1]|uniref:TetR/AcrR family transcriptional regulator n=1 Tax=Jiella flava TaxID=2816857 RepID=A0A939JVN5_9HYPH|nr:TetR/AcrR family transcriptional regulator [Jiella flava]MBO0661461.1 TetR/AcrR family transcriptional regulator [Jiella flava]MCD2470104.1 TetR/AcrR family transcriptional regulator [Jiella flava]
MAEIAEPVWIAANASQAEVTPFEQRRQQILQAARGCFSRLGFHSASMHQICAQAQMSPGALYRYFPSKDAIIEAIAEDERHRAAACMQGLWKDGLVIDRIVQVGMEYLRSTRDRTTGGLTIEIWSESIRNTAVGRRFCEIETHVRETLHALLLDARERGEIDVDIDLKTALTVIFALADGLVLHLQLRQDVDVEMLEPQMRRCIENLLAPKDGARGAVSEDGTFRAASFDTLTVPLHERDDDDVSPRP